MNTTLPVALNVKLTPGIEIQKLVLYCPFQVICDFPSRKHSYICTTKELEAPNQAAASHLNPRTL